MAIDNEPAPAAIAGSPDVDTPKPAQRIYTGQVTSSSGIRIYAFHDTHGHYTCPLCRFTITSRSDRKKMNRHPCTPQSAPSHDDVAGTHSTPVMQVPPMSGPVPACSMPSIQAASTLQSTEGTTLLGTTDAVGGVQVVDILSDLSLAFDPYHRILVCPCHAAQLDGTLPAVRSHFHNHQGHSVAQLTA